MRLVLDTSVIVAALRSGRGASSRILRDAVVGRHQLLGSVALALEYESVCLRQEHIRESGLSRQDVVFFVADIIALLDAGTRYWTYRPALRDADDEMVLEVAINLRADAIVTFNTRDFAKADRFGVSVVTPGDFLGSLQT